MVEDPLDQLTDLLSQDLGVRHRAQVLHEKRDFMSHAATPNLILVFPHEQLPSLEAQLSRGERKNDSTLRLADGVSRMPQMMLPWTSGGRSFMRWLASGGVEQGRENTLRQASEPNYGGQD